MFLFSLTLINFSVCLCSLFQGITTAQGILFSCMFLWFHKLNLTYFICSFTLRYTTWLSSGLSARKASDRSSNLPADVEWALSVPVEDFIYVSGIYNNI
jgi:hypothetical protein